MIAGAIAEGFTMVGQIIGGIAALTITPQVLEQYGFRAINLVRDTSYWAAGLGTALCFGLVEIRLSALVGWLVILVNHPGLVTLPPSNN